jgi:hypothetical protein
MMRRLIIDTIRNDPAWMNGNYTTQPTALKAANVFYGIATAGGTLAYQAAAPTREKADKLLDARLAAPFTADANDSLYQWESSGDYDAAPGLEDSGGASARSMPRTTGATRLNRPDGRCLKRVKSDQLYLIPKRRHPRPRHHRHGQVLRQQLRELLQTASATCEPRLGWWARRSNLEIPVQALTLPLRRVARSSCTRRTFPRHSNPSAPPRPGGTLRPALIIRSVPRRRPSRLAPSSRRLPLWRRTLCRIDPLRTALVRTRHCHPGS